MSYIHTQEISKNPLIFSFGNPTNLLSLGGQAEKAARIVNEWSFDKHSKGDFLQNFPVKRQDDLPALYQIVKMGILVGVGSCVLLFTSIHYSYSDFNHNPIYLAINYLGIVTLMLYQVGTNSWANLKRDRKAIKVRENWENKASKPSSQPPPPPQNVFIGTSFLHNPVYVDLSNVNNKAAFKSRYHAKVAIYVYELLTQISVVVVCCLGIAGIMDTKRLSQVTLAVGSLGYGIGSYFLNVFADYHFFSNAIFVPTDMPANKFIALPAATPPTPAA